MTYEDIIYDGCAPVAGLTLNRPSERNAYTSRMCRELLHALDRYQRDDDVRVLVLTRAGGGPSARGATCAPPWRPRRRPAVSSATAW